MRGVARGADLDEGTVRRILAGAAWPDLHTIARLEQSIGIRLYPVKRAGPRAEDEGEPAPRSES